MRKIVLISLILLSYVYGVWGQDEGIHQLDLDNTSTINMQVSPDGSLMATYSDFVILSDPPPTQELMIIHIYDMQSGELIQELISAKDFASTIAFSSDNQWLATAHLNGLIHIWDIASGEITQTLYGSSLGASYIQFLDDDQQLFSRYNSIMSEYMRWGIETASIQNILTYRFDSRHQMMEETNDMRYERIGQFVEIASAVSPQETHMIAASQAGALWLWDLDDPYTNPQLLLDGLDLPNFPIRQIYWLPNGESVIFYYEASDEDMETGLYQLDVFTGELTLLISDVSMRTFALSPDGETVAWADRDAESLVFAPLSALGLSETVELDAQGYSTFLWNIPTYRRLYFVNDGKQVVIGGFLSDEDTSDFVYIVDVP